MSRQTWIMCSTRKLTALSREPVRQMKTLENPCPFVGSTVKTTSLSILLQIPTIYITDLPYPLREVLIKHKKKLSISINWNETDYIKGVLTVTVRFTLEDDNKSIETLLVVDGVYKRLRLLILLTFGVETHQFVASFKLASCEEGYDWKSGILHKCLAVRNDRQTTKFQEIDFYRRLYVTVFVFVFLDSSIKIF